MGSSSPAPRIGICNAGSGTLSTLAPVASMILSVMRSM